MTILVAGSVFLDIVMCHLDHAPRPGEEQWVEHCNVLPGGAANQAVAAARLGASAALVTYLGEDDLGQMVRKMLKDESVCLAQSSSTARQSLTVALVHDGDRSFTTFGSDDAPQLAGEAPEVLMASLPYLKDNEATVRSWHDNGTIVIADTGWDETGQWDESDLDILECADIFVPNCSEAEHYTRTLGAAEAAVKLSDKVPTVIVTCGARGVTLCQFGEVSIHEAPEAEVLDTTGAGDSFSAGLAVGLTRSMSIEDAISLGQLSATWTVGHLGGSTSAPTLGELAGWIDSRADLAPYRRILDQL